MEEEKERKDPEIKWVDGMPCIVVPPGTFRPKKQDTANHPFAFGRLQEQKERRHMPDIIREFQDIIGMPFMPVKWKLYEFKNGEFIEIKNEDEENDNSK